MNSDKPKGVNSMIKKTGIMTVPTEATPRRDSKFQTLNLTNDSVNYRSPGLMTTEIITKKRNENFTSLGLSQV